MGSSTRKTERPDGQEVLTRLHQAGVGFYLKSFTVGSYGVRGFLDVEALAHLAAHSKFQSGPFHLLHYVGEDPIEFRSYRDAFGEDTGSLQVAADLKTGRFEADVDKYSPYEDLVGIFGHLLVEVAPNWVRGLFSKRKQG